MMIKKVFTWDKIDGDIIFYEDEAMIDYDDVVELLNENNQLKQELIGMEELLRSYRKTIEHDAKLLADATKNGYLPPLEGWEWVE